MSPRTAQTDRRARRVVCVTGASAGLGRAIAVAFGRAGDKVALLARDEERLKDAAREVVDSGGEALVVPADVASYAELVDAATRVASELGPIDVWVNNAMASVFAPFLDTDMEEFRRATEVDYLGFVHGTRVALDAMVPRNHGVVVQVSSALAFRSIPLQSPYCGAKHGIVGFTESLRTELRHDHRDVHVTMVHMPALNTPQFNWVRSALPRRARPVAPVYAPEVGARAVVWSADHPKRREVYVGGSTMATVLAQRVAPALLDRYLARTGYDAQQTDEREDPHRPDDLFETVEGHETEHGRFGDEAHARSVQLWLTLHRRGVAVAAGVVALGALAAGPGRGTARALLGAAAGGARELVTSRRLRRGAPRGATAQVAHVAHVGRSLYAAGALAVARAQHRGLRRPTPAQRWQRAASRMVARGPVVLFSRVLDPLRRIVPQRTR